MLGLVREGPQTWKQTGVGLADEKVRAGCEQTPGRLGCQSEEGKAPSQLSGRVVPAAGSPAQRLGNGMLFLPLSSRISLWPQMP